MGFWEFWHEHSFLAWCALWLGWGVFWLAAIALEFMWELCNRLLRTVSVCARGWPPAHLDADGDWRPASKALSAADLPAESGAPLDRLPV